MSSLNTHFGIGTDTEITSITIYWPSGIIDVIEDVNINETITVVEGQVLGQQDNLVTNLIAFPNPTTNVLNVSNINELENPIYTIFDTTGRRVANAKLTSNSIDVSYLSQGNYTLRVFDNNTRKVQRFIKK
jgi:hypothetical protein